MPMPPQILFPFQNATPLSLRRVDCQGSLGPQRSGGANLPRIGEAHHRSNGRQPVAGSTSILRKRAAQSAPSCQASAGNALATRLGSRASVEPLLEVRGR